MSGESDDSEKEHDPTEQRLREAREKGDVPRGRDLFAAAGAAGLLLALAVEGEGMIEGIGTFGMVLLDQSPELAPLVLGSGGGPVGGMLGTVALATAPLFVLPFATALAAIAVQRALVVTPANLMPKLSRISPLAGARNKFGRSGLFDFAKSVTKLVAVSAVFGTFLVSHAPEILGTLHLGPGPAMGALGQMMVEFLALVVLLQAVIGGLDLFFQTAEHRRRNRMSRRELLDEMKQVEGDPHLKAERRQRGVDIATNRMLAEVPKADVVIVNPTHYAVALAWNRNSGRAPVCVAKGVDEIAARIREAAQAAGVPIRRDPPTARVLHATVDIGAEIEPDHYRAVAAAIRFAEAMRRRARSGWRSGGR
jgi:flagellar biosynthetic protein FlhB